MDSNEIDDFIEELRNGFKYKDEGKFNYELILNSTSDSIKKLREKQETSIQFLKSHPDSKKRFEIVTKLVNKLENEKSFDFTDVIPEHAFLESKKSIQNMDPILVDFDRFRESDKTELDKNAELVKSMLCKTYAFNFDDICKSYFRLFTRIIKDKKISECAVCIDVINKYEPSMKFITLDFIPQIRNSVKHEDAYYDYTHNGVIFPDRDKTPIGMSLSQLRQGCRMLMVDKVCIDAAINVKHLPGIKMTEYYFEKTEEYCKLLQLDFKHVLRYTMEKGYNLLYIFTLLEKKIQSLK